jgi:GT2 family glycosyltransferase/glycosyltransferase involved in cell wall biosynthesis
VQDKRVIFVLGAPRTGTSALASVLINLGVNFGDERNFVDTRLHTHNPKGFFELQWVNQLNDEIFAQLNASWRSCDFFTADSFKSPDLFKYKLQLFESVRKEWEPDSPLIGIKDPRISLLFPLWESVFLSLGYTIKCLVTVRHPLGYLQSDKQINPLWSNDYMLLEWLRHLLSALYFSKHCDTKIVDFDPFVASPQALVADLARWLGIIDVDINEACKSVDRSLYHHNYEGLETWNPFINSIYDSLLSAEGKPASVSSAVKFYEAFLELWPLIKSRQQEAENTAVQGLRALLAEKELALHTAAERERLAQHLQAISEDERQRLTKQLAGKEQAIDVLNAQLANQDQTARELATLLAEKERAIEENNAARELEALLAEKERALHASAEREQIARSLQASNENERQRLTKQLAGKEQAIDVLNAQLANQDQTARNLAAQLAEKERETQALAAKVADKEARLREITSTMGWRLLSAYGRRIKYPYLLPLYRLYGRIKYRYLLPLYKREEPPSPEPTRVANQPPPKAVAFPAQHQASAPSQKQIAINPVAPAPPLASHRATAEVIVCVHNALEDVKRCLESVLRHTSMPYSLILVDDGSNAETRDYLADFARSHQVRLIRNEEARGYTFAANQGLRQTQADYVVLLNSDTVVTPDWLDRVIACGESDPRIGLIGPLSNAASWQSIPEITRNGDWAENELPEGATITDMGGLVARYAARLYPRLPFLNGFCLVIKRPVIEQLGYFDEQAFGRGYGEENDYCMRARKAGWQLAIAEDAYVYHRQSRSYSHERRKELSRYADVALAEKHGRQMVDDGVAVCRFDRVLEGIRARSQVMALRQQYLDNGRALWEGKRVLFILPISETGGGGNIVLDEASAMQKMGVEVALLNLNRYRKGFEQSYSDNTLPVIYVTKETEVSEVILDYDAAIATWCASVDWLTSSSARAPSLIRGYYIQDFEPYFFSEGSPEFSMAWDSYTRFPDLVRITKTEWNRATVQREIGVECNVVGPSVNLDLYRPRRRQSLEGPQRPVRIAAMIRPSSPRRAPKLTLEILRELYGAHGDRIEIILFGCHADDLYGLGVANDFSYAMAGVLTRTQTAALLNEVDVFVDFSTYQAMGLTAMEAMGCGAAVIVPQQGGAVSFVKHEENGIVVDTRSKVACRAALDQLIIDERLRTRLQRQALFDVCQFFPERPAYNILNAMFQASSPRTFAVPIQQP